MALKQISHIFSNLFKVENNLMFIATPEFYPKSTLVSVSNELSMVAFHVVLVYIAFISHIQNFAAGEFSM